ncbi:MAG: UDP-3-O-acyl-N-acetylglucosamine deacetylase, partial [Marinicaulis sp.]|nr:UDP-3-O-acyl-N-acetylglucosamine deacetylase [Marinicaulis sp.]
MRFDSRQVTLRRAVEFSGMGLHNGHDCRIVLHPAAVD